MVLSTVSERARGEMDIISDYGSDVWGSNPYGPTTLSTTRIKTPGGLFGGGAQKVDPLIGWPVGRRKGRGQRAGGQGGGSKPSRGNHYASGQPFDQSTLSLVGLTVPGRTRTSMDAGPYLRDQDGLACPPAGETALRWLPLQLRLRLRHPGARRVDVRPVLEITELDDAIMDGLDVFWVDRHLPATAWGVDDELRHRVTGRVPTQGADDVDALLDRRPKMGRPLDEVAGV